jgi:hypothetical protein
LRVGESALQIPGPGSAAFLAAAAAAWAASQVNASDGGGWLIRVFLVVLAVVLAYAGFQVEKVHTESNLRKARIEKGLPEDPPPKPK